LPTIVLRWRFWVGDRTARNPRPPGMDIGEERAFE
jgi:hypothetical protein